MGKGMEWGDLEEGGGGEGGTDGRTDGEKRGELLRKLKEEEEELGNDDDGDAHLRFSVFPLAPPQPHSAAASAASK